MKLNLHVQGVMSVCVCVCVVCSHTLMKIEKKQNYKKAINIFRAFFSKHIKLKYNFLVRFFV